MKSMSLLGRGILRTYTFRSAAWITLAGYFVRVAGFLFVLIAYRKLSAAGYGEYVLVNAYFNVLGIISGLGLSNLVNARIADRRENSILLPAYNITSGLILLAAAGILYSVKRQIPLGALLGFCANSSLSQILYMRYFQEQRHKDWAVFNLAQSCLANVAMIGGLAFGMGVPALLEINFAVKAAACILLLVQGRASISFFGGSGLRLSFGYFYELVKGSGFWMIVNSLANKAVSESVPIVFGEGASLSILGAYDMIFKVIALLGAPLYSMETIVASRQSKSRIGEIRRKYLPYIIGSSLGLTAGAFAAILLVYAVFLKAVLDVPFVAGVAFFSLTVATLGYRVFCRASLTILEKTRHLLVNSMATTVFQLAYTILLVKTGNTRLYQVGIMYFATSVFSTILYEINYASATKGAEDGK